MRVGLPDRYVTHGKPALLHEEVGFTGERIAERVDAAISDRELGGARAEGSADATGPAIGRVVGALTRSFNETARRGSGPSRGGGIQESWCCTLDQQAMMARWTRLCVRSITEQASIGCAVLARRTIECSAGGGV